MDVPQITRSALVISTTPPIPRDYGNRNRVYQTLQFLRDSGFRISFLLYPFDEDWANAVPPYYSELVSQFEYFAVIPNSRPLHQPAAGYHHDIDEWWDENIGRHLDWLFRRKRYDLLFVNHTFLSRAFEHAPKGVLRVLDTHDLFTDRRETFERHEVEAEFFYTNAAQEQIAFNRADGIIAIKPSEAEFIRTLTTSHVATIPYWDDHPPKLTNHQDRASRVFSHDMPLRAGFIGAENSVNTVNLRRFLEQFDRYLNLYNLPVEIVIAGNVCRRLDVAYSFVRKLGRVASVEDFYKEIDIVLAPLKFSTGIKIKVGEALARRLPIMATFNAFDGFRPFHPTHSQKSVANLCESIAATATNEIPYSELFSAARRAAVAAQRAQDRGFGDLREWLKHQTQRIVIVTDRSFFYRATFMDELISQTIEYISHIKPVVLVVLGQTTSEHIKAGWTADHVLWSTADQLIEVMRTLASVSTISAIVNCVSEADLVLSCAKTLKFQAWTLAFTDPPSAGLKFVSIPQLCHPIYVAPLRYAPSKSQLELAHLNLTIFRPDDVSEWEELVFSQIEALATVGGISVTTVSVPIYAEYSTSFMVSVIRDPSSKVVLLNRHVTSRLFIAQCCKYRGIEVFFVDESFSLNDTSEALFPSLNIGISGFISRFGNKDVLPSSNGGWSSLWKALSAEA